MKLKRIFGKRKEKGFLKGQVKIKIIKIFKFYVSNKTLQLF